MQMEFNGGDWYSNSVVHMSSWFEAANAEEWRRRLRKSTLNWTASRGDRETSECSNVFYFR